MQQLVICNDFNLLHKSHDKCGNVCDSGGNVCNDGGNVCDSGEIESVLEYFDVSPNQGTMSHNIVCFAFAWLYFVLSLLHISLNASPRGNTSSFLCIRPQLRGLLC